LICTRKRRVKARHVGKARLGDAMHLRKARRVEARHIGEKRHLGKESLGDARNIDKARRGNTTRQCKIK